MAAYPGEIEVTPRVTARINFGTTTTSAKTAPRPRAVGGVSFSLAAVVASVAAYSGFSYLTASLLALCFVSLKAAVARALSVFLSEGGVEEFFMNEGGGSPRSSRSGASPRDSPRLSPRESPRLSPRSSRAPSWEGPPPLNLDAALDDASLSPAVRAVLAAKPWRLPPQPACCAPAEALEPWLRAVRSRLSAAEAAALASVKRELASELPASDPEMNDGTIVRYLRGEKWREKVAVEAIRKSIAWRRETDAASRPHRLLRASHWPELTVAPRSTVASGWRAGWHGCDREGRPVFIDRTLGMDVNGMKRASSEWGTEVVEMALAEAERHTEFSARHYKLVGGGAPFETHVVVIDCAGMAMWTFTNHCIPVFKQISAQASAHYPDTVHSMIIVNAPRWFYSVYALVERFIDPVTRAKIQMCASTEALFELIPKQALPPCLGGTCADDHALGPP